MVSCARNEFDSFLRDHKTSLDFHGHFNVKSVIENPIVALGETASKDELVKINIKSASSLKSALEEVKKSLFLIRGQFEFNLAPYPGQITTVANCGNDFKPTIVFFESITTLKAYSNERLALSICKEDDYFYQIYTSYFFNEKEHQLLIVDYYQQKKTASEDKAKVFFQKNFGQLKNIDLKML